jgi:hypothetical protein
MKAEKLTRLIGVRVSDTFYSQLEEKRKKTNCQTLSEFARAILYKEKIMFYYTDASLNATAIQLAGIRKELNQIGNNINQITKSFHSADAGSQKMFHALKVSEEYKRVENKVDKLLIMVSEITKRWLQG